MPSLTRSQRQGLCGISPVNKRHSGITSFSGMCWYRLMSAARNEEGWHVWSRKQANARLMRDKASGSNLILAHFSLQCSPTAFDLGTLRDVFSLWSLQGLGPGFLISSRWIEFLSYSKRPVCPPTSRTDSAHESFSPSCSSTLIFGKSNAGKKQVSGPGNAEQGVISCHV